jgi:hypothetical protein
MAKTGDNALLEALEGIEVCFKFSPNLCKRITSRDQLVIKRLTQEIDEEILRMGNDEIKARARAIDNEIKVRFKILC